MDPSARQKIQTTAITTLVDAAIHSASEMSPPRVKNPPRTAPIGSAMIDTIRRFRIGFSVSGDESRNGSNMRSQ